MTTTLKTTMKENTTMSIKGTVDQIVDIDGRIETTIDYDDALADITTERFKAAAANVTEDLEKVFPDFQGINVTRFELANDTLDSQSKSQRRKRQSGAAIAIFEAESKSNIDKDEILKEAESNAKNFKSLTVEAIANSIETLEIKPRNTTTEATESTASRTTSSSTLSPTSSTTTTTKLSTTTTKPLLADETTPTTANTTTSENKSAESKSSFSVLNPSILILLITYLATI